MGRGIARTNNSATSDEQGRDDIAPHVAGAIAMCYAMHPEEVLPHITMLTWSRRLRAFSEPVLIAATDETLGRVKWFPKLQEIEEAARMIDRLITGRGMYSHDEKGIKLFKATIAWRNECHPDTLAFIEKQKATRYVPIKRRLAAQ